MATGAGTATSVWCYDEEWESIADKLVNAGTRFIIEPQVRFVGE